MYPRILASWLALILARVATAADPSEGQVLPSPNSSPHKICDAAVKTASSSDAQESSSEKNALLQQKLRDVERLQGEIQQLRTELGSQQQILVRVEMLEVSLTKLRKLGVDVPGVSSGFLGAAELAQLQAGLKHSTPAHPPGNSVRSFVECLEQNNVARVLARPTVVVVSGRPASVFVGDEIPMPPAQDPNAAVEFQKVGTELDVLAISQNNNRVRLELRARVSEPDESRSLAVNGSLIPALNVRQCCTAVEGKFGEPVILTGLINKRIEAVKTESGTKEVTNHVSLMVVVTPELVDLSKSAERPTQAELRK